MFEAYKVGVTLALTSQVSNILGLIARDFIKTDKEAKKLQLELKKIKLLGMSGALLGGAGFMGLLAIKGAIKPASEYVHQLELARAAGMSQLEIAQATAAAWATTGKVMTTTATDNLKALRELRMVFGDTADAIKFLPQMQTIQSVLDNVLHGTGGNAHDEAYTVAKALEMKGAVRNPAQFENAADLMTKAMIASGGKVAAQDFLSAFKYGRSATIGWDDRFTYGILPTLIQEMKSSGGSGGSGGPGNALMSAYAAVVGGTIPQKSLKVWQKLGLLDPSKIVWDKVGSAKGVGPGGILGSSAFQQDPYQWTQNYLVPALVKAGYDTEAKQRQVLQYLFPNRTAGFIMSQMALQGWKFDRDQKLIGQASGLSAYDEMIKRDPEMAMRALGAQWENLKTALGIGLVPILIPFLRNLTTAFNALAGFAQKHPTLTQGLMATFAGLSLLATIGGGLMLAGAALKMIGLAMTTMTGLPLARRSCRWQASPAGLVTAALCSGTAASFTTRKSPTGSTKRLRASVTFSERTEISGATPVQVVSSHHLWGSKPDHVQTQVNLDGRRIADVVTTHQYDAANTSPASGNGFDGRQSFVAPAFNPFGGS